MKNRKIGRAGVVVEHSALESEYEPGASSPRTVDRVAGFQVTFCG